MRSLTLTALVACFAFGGFSRADAAVELRLNSGDVMVGELASEDDKNISLKRVIMVKNKVVETVVTVPKNTIAARKEVPSYKEQYKTRADNTPAVLLAQCSLARWCYERALLDEALVHTRKADALESHNPIVTKLFTDLGFVKEDNTWISQDEYLAKTGKINVGGTLMTKEEAELAKTKTVQTITVARLEQQIRDAESLIKVSEGKVTEYQEQLAKAKSEGEKAKADANGAKNRMDQAQKRMEERNNQNSNNRTQEQNKRDVAAVAEAKSDFNKANSAQKKADKDTEVADERLKKYKSQLEKAKTELAELKKQLAEMTAKADEKGEGDKNKTDAKTENQPDAKAPAKPEMKTDDKNKATTEEKKTEKPQSRFGEP
jgi:hypothetical protein